MSLLFGMFSSEKAWCQHLSVKCQKEGVNFQAEAKVWLQNVLEKQEEAEVEDKIEEILQAKKD